MIWRRQSHMYLAYSIGVLCKYFAGKDVFYKTVTNECIIRNHDGCGTVILIAFFPANDAVTVIICSAISNPDLCCNLYIECRNIITIVCKAWLVAVTTETV